MSLLQVVRTNTKRMQKKPVLNTQVLMVLGVMDSDEHTKSDCVEPLTDSTMICTGIISA